MRATATTTSPTTPGTCCCAPSSRPSRDTDEQASRRHLQASDIHIDLAARTVDVAGTGVHVSRLEFELLVKFARDPVRVVSKHELARCI
jgi:DNA-binding response OmpR family regulator